MGLLNNKDIENWMMHYSLTWILCYEEMYVSSYFYSLNNYAASYYIRNLKCKFQNLLKIKLKFQNLIKNPGRIPGKFRDFDRDRDSKK